MILKTSNIMLLKEDTYPIFHIDIKSCYHESGKDHHQYHHYSRRWVVVERTNSWHNRFRKLLVRYEKK